jgi:hypothetical protein
MPTLFVLIWLVALGIVVYKRGRTAVVDDLRTDA